MCATLTCVGRVALSPDVAQRMLYDLVPPSYARRLVIGCARIPSVQGRACVLQLDICNFTVLSQAMAPVKLAEVINQLISSFDELVMGRNLTKIDTIGDAYIVVGCAFPTVMPHSQRSHPPCLLIVVTER